MIYFIIWAVLHALLIVLNLIRHGQVTTYKYGFFKACFRLGLNLWFMYMWGAFDTLIGSTP